MRRTDRIGLAALVALGLAGSAAADEVPSEDVTVDHRGAGFDQIADPVIRDMLALDAIAPFEDLAPLWDWRDARLQRELDRAIARLELAADARRGRLAVTLVDVSDPDRPRVAGVNPDRMMYAASLPKIAVLLAAFEKIAQGQMRYDAENRELLELMIRRSNNEATTELMHRVGKKYIARVLLSPRYRLYDPRRNGGLWVGKDYAKSGLWRRDPLHNLSHGATAMQVARFYYLLHTGNLVTPKWSQEMKRVMAGDDHIQHKFVRGLGSLRPRARVMRKSGSWGTYHSDSALIERDGKSYIAVALSNDPHGSSWLGELIVELDGIIAPQAAARMRKD